MRLVTVATFPDSQSAYLARARLEVDGIEAFTADDALVQVNWLYSAALGGVKVQVDEADADRAKTLLAEDRRAEIADTARHFASRRRRGF